MNWPFMFLVIGPILGILLGVFLASRSIESKELAGMLVLMYLMYIVPVILSMGMFLLMAYGLFKLLGM